MKFRDKENKKIKNLKFLRKICIISNLVFVLRRDFIKYFCFASFTKWNYFVFLIIMRVRFVRMHFHPWRAKWHARNCYPIDIWFFSKKFVDWFNRDMSFNRIFSYLSRVTWSQMFGNLILVFNYWNILNYIINNF